MTSTMTLPEAARVQRLEPVTGRVRVVVDTDAANEIDDQFALAYAVPVARAARRRGGVCRAFPAAGTWHAGHELARILCASGGGRGPEPCGDHAGLGGLGRRRPSGKGASRCRGMAS